MLRWGYRWTCLTELCGAMGVRELVLSFLQPLSTHAKAGDYLEFFKPGMVYDEIIEEVSDEVRAKVLEDRQRHSEMRQ